MDLSKEKDFVTIYAIVHTAVDADRCCFPDPAITGSYLSLVEAQTAWEQQIDEEKKLLDERYDCEAWEPFQWEMYQDGYAGACFYRIEIVESVLHLNGGEADAYIGD